MAKKQRRPQKPRKGRRIPLILVLAIIAALVGASMYFFGSSADTARVRIGAQEFVLEVAASQTTRTAGLSNRDALPENGGMLFIYPGPTAVNFWMKDTRIPLTAAYLDASGTIVEMHDLQPMVEDGFPSKNPVSYVIELNQGAFAHTGAGIGDTVVSITGKDKYKLGF